MTEKDLRDRGWDQLDIILVTGDAYVDHPSYGAAVIGRVLENAGYKVGIIAQPNWRNNSDFTRLGKPRLFFGVTAGNVDSMIANYTANKKPRNEDDYSCGGKIGLRPDRATLVYCTRLRDVFGKVPIVIGGLEASMRRLAHYDYWDHAVRASILADARADILVYGMGERQVLEIADRLNRGEAAVELNNIRGTVVQRENADFIKDPVILPSFDQVRGDFEQFNRAFRLAYESQNPLTSRALVQPHYKSVIIHFPPAEPFNACELDRIFELPYTRQWHPSYNACGGVKGLETVKFSIISHRGCCGECAFCGLYLHQGRIVQSRTQESIFREAQGLAKLPDFKGMISDIGGPTVNMYLSNCPAWKKNTFCKDKNCLMPHKCPNLELEYDQSLALYARIRQIPKVKYVFLGSGFRYDLFCGSDGERFLRELCKHYISGQMKVAPEHACDGVLRLMNKPPLKKYEHFRAQFNRAISGLDKKLYLVNYFISAHPGSSMAEAESMYRYLVKHGIHSEQTQDFIPLPMTLSAAMYWTGRHPFTGEGVYVARTFHERKVQRALLQYKNPLNRKFLHEVFRETEGGKRIGIKKSRSHVQVKNRKNRRR